MLSCDARQASWQACMAAVAHYACSTAMNMSHAVYRASSWLSGGKHGIGENRNYGVQSRTHWMCLECGCLGQQLKIWCSMTYLDSLECRCLGTKAVNCWNSCPNRKWYHLIMTTSCLLFLIITHDGGCDWHEGGQLWNFDRLGEGTIGSMRLWDAALNG